jgi:hypothetical protein
LVQVFIETPDDALLYFMTEKVKNAWFDRFLPAVIGGMKSAKRDEIDVRWEPRGTVVDGQANNQGI